MKKLLNKQKGLTLTELLVVMSVISILLSITIVGYSSFIKKSAISNDELVANRLNTILEEIKSNKILDDNTIAIIVQEELGENACIESSKYGMNIYYNDIKQIFEVIPDDIAGDFDKLEDYINSITFHIDRTYIYSLKGKSFSTLDGTDKDIVNLFINGNELLATVRINESNRIDAPTIYLSKIFYAKHSSMRISDLKFIFQSCDLRNEDETIYIECDEVLATSYLSNPGKYKITVFCEEYPSKSWEVELLVKNIYYSKEPEISVSEERYKWNVISNNDDTYNVELTSPDLLNKILIKDYDTNYSFQESFMKLSYFETYGSQYTNNIEISFEMNNQNIILKLDSDNINKIENGKPIYTIIFESIDINKNTTINITYKYQATNGAYYYCDEEISINQNNN